VGGFGFGSGGFPKKKTEKKREMIFPLISHNSPTTS
jgi:hypothetical protein